MKSGFFASETYAGAHPAVSEAVREAGAGHQAPYGDDSLSAELKQRFEQHFGPGVEAFPVFNGTAANIAALGAVLAPHEAVICPRSAHLNQDECGAFERILGRKLLLATDVDGKLTPAAIETCLRGVGETRAAQPRVVSITQCTELGTTYSPAELRELTRFAHARGLLVHADGARLANAAAFLGTDLAGASRECGVDLLSLGFTKNGGLCADAVLLFGAEAVQEARFLQKQLMQVASKTRFLAAQILALLSEDLWRRNAEHANAMAQRLAAGVAEQAGVRITRPVEANSVFAALAPWSREALLERFHFYVWDEAADEVRWTCSWNTEPEEVDALVLAVRDVASN